MADRASLHRLGSLFGLALLYLGAAKLGLSLDPVGGFATLVWAPTGIALAALVRGGVWLWPAITLGAFGVNAWAGAPPHVALGIGLGNTLEALLGAALLARIADDLGPIERLREAFGLIAVSLASPVVSASIGVASLTLSGVVAAEHAGRTWMAWWLGDALGGLVVAPLILSWSAKPRLAQERSRLEGGALALTTVAFTAGVFAGQSRLPFAEPYVIFLPLIWAAIRFGSRASTLAVVAISGLAIGYTVRGLGPFAMPSVSTGLIALQAFMGFVAATTLLLAAASDERGTAMQEVQRALQTRDEFLAVASHELRTPLSALSMQISGLLQSTRAAPPGTPIGRDGVERIERARVQVERLSTLVDELLDVSRLSAGRLQLRPEPFDLSETVRDLTARMQDQATCEGCELRVTAPVGVRGVWDRLRIEQVIGNLLSNAFKYGEGRPVDVAVATRGPFAVLSVRDRGVGIRAEDLWRIFERFGRAVHARRYKGLGLGLYIARQVVDAHGGSIRVDSTCGVGSTFTVQLPLMPPTARPEES